jgi:hypothetical protein
MFYLRFYSCIYHFYVRKNESMPVFFTLGVSSFILYFNILTIYDVLKYFWFTNLPFSILFSYCLFGVICILNYLIVFLPGKYKFVPVKPNTGIYIIIYMVISFIFFIWIITLHHDRNVEKKNQSHTSIYIRKVKEQVVEY